MKPLTQLNKVAFKNAKNKSNVFDDYYVSLLYHKYSAIIYNKTNNKITIILLVFKNYSSHEAYPLVHSQSLMGAVVLKY